MIIFIVSFTFLILGFFGYQKDKSIISPLFIMPFLWSVFLLMYCLVPHGLYALHEQFLFSLFLWVFSFLIGGYFINTKTYSVEIFNQDYSLYNKPLFNIFFFTVLLLAPLALMLLIIEATKVGFEFFFLRLRMINTGIDEDETFSLGILAYVFNFTNVVLLLFTFYKEKISQFRYYIVLLLQVLLGLITLARTSLVVLILSIFIILYFKKLLKKSHYVGGIIVLFLFIFLITFLRGFHESNSSDTNEFAIYLFAGMPAFDTIDYRLQEQFGSYTFRFFYAILNAFGGNYIVEKTILPYTNIPDLTNVYTVMFPFFKDFGYKGIVFFGLFYGTLSNLLFKHSIRNNSLAIIGYAFIFPILLLQFFGEYLFSNLSTYLQFFVILLITKYFKSK